MTDEEMAEEYYYKTYPVTLNIGEEERKKKVTDIFLAGYKAGFKDCAKSRLNVTTISDCPNKDEVQLEYARTIIKDLLDNSDEYARERAINFLKEIE